MVLHAGGNMFSAFGLITKGRSEWQLSTAPQPLIWQSGPDAAFWGNLIALLVFATLSILPSPVWPALRARSVQQVPPDKRPLCFRPSGSHGLAVSLRHRME